MTKEDAAACQRERAKWRKETCRGPHHSGRAAAISGLAPPCSAFRGLLFFSECVEKLLWLAFAVYRAYIQLFLDRSPPTYYNLGVRALAQVHQCADFCIKQQNQQILDLKTLGNFLAPECRISSGMVLKSGDGFHGHSSLEPHMKAWMNVLGRSPIDSIAYLKDTKANDSMWRTMNEPILIRPHHLLRLLVQAFPHPSWSASPSTPPLGYPYVCRQPILRLRMSPSLSFLPRQTH
jgi:hypothetical protein